MSDNTMPIPTVPSSAPAAPSSFSAPRIRPPLVNNIGNSGILRIKSLKFIVLIIIMIAAISGIGIYVYKRYKHGVRSAINNTNINTTTGKIQKVNEEQENDLTYIILDKHDNLHKVSKDFFMKLSNSLDNEKINYGDE